MFNVFCFQMSTKLLIFTTAVLVLLTLAAKTTCQSACNHDCYSRYVHCNRGCDGWQECIVCSDGWQSCAGGCRKRSMPDRPDDILREELQRQTQKDTPVEQSAEEARAIYTRLLRLKNMQKGSQDELLN